VLEIPFVIADGGKDTYSVTLQKRAHSLGEYVFDLNQDTVTLNEPGVPTCAEGGTCVIGDTGPGGGKVFYISQDGSSGLEAALTDAGYAEWGCFGIYVGATGIAIGTGKSNTDTIIDKCKEATAAKLARNYEWPSGQNDGFLPSFFELEELFKHKDKVVGFTSGYYWTSTEVNIYNAVALNFDVVTCSFIKLNTCLVRAVRAF
jgi:hypothetical protein